MLTKIIQFLNNFTNVNLFNLKNKTDRGGTLMGTKVSILDFLLIPQNQIILNMNLLIIFIPIVKCIFAWKDSYCYNQFQKNI